MGKGLLELIFGHLNTIAKSNLIIERKPGNVTVNNTYNTYILQLKQENKLLRDKVKLLERKNKIIEIEGEDG